MNLRFFSYQPKTPRQLTCQAVAKVASQQSSIITPYSHLSALPTVILTGLMTAGGIAITALPSLAEGTPAGSIIRNQAKASFDNANSPGSGSPIVVDSNEVSVIVSEIAGITLSPLGATEAPSGVSGAGPQQDNGQINGSDILYFDYVITNVGNDPTQFFIPDRPSSIVNATFDAGLYGPIQIIGYDPDGPSGASAATDLSGTPVAVPNGGSATGNLSIPGSTGSFAPDGTVTVRIPVKLNTGLAVNDIVEVRLGNTDPAPNNQNQPLSPSGSNTDLTTQDNSGTSNGDQDGAPVNGEREASINQTAIVSNLAGSPNVLLVKRITAINGQPISLDGDDLAIYTDEAANPYDDNDQDIPGPQTIGGPQPDTTNWPDPSSFLIGGIDGGNVRPGDELEYTIYFLSTGELDAQDVVFCDRVPENVTFTPTAFNSGFPTDPNGIITTDHGILLNQNGTSLSLSNVADGDRGRYFPPNSSLTDIYPQLTNCGTNDNGAVVVELQTLPTATAPGLPTDASGFVRFRAQVK